VGTIAIGAATLEYLLWTLGKVPSALHVDVGMIHNIGIYEGYIAMSHSSIVSLIFVVPFLMACLVVYGRDCIAPIGSRKLLWCSLMMGIAVALVGGRRALVIVVLLAPFMIGFLVRQLPRSSERRGKNALGSIFCGLELWF